MTSIKENNLYKLYQDVTARPFLQQEARALNSKLHFISSALAEELLRVNSTTLFMIKMKYQRENSNNKQAAALSGEEILILKNKEERIIAIENFVLNIMREFGEEKAVGIQKFLERDVLIHNSKTLYAIANETWK